MMYILDQNSLLVLLFRAALLVKEFRESIRTGTYDEEEGEICIYMVDGSQWIHQLSASYYGTIFSHRGYPNASYPSSEILSYVNITGLDPRINQYVAIKFKDFDLTGDTISLSIDDNNDTSPFCDVCSFLSIGNTHYFNGSVHWDNKTINVTRSLRPPIDKWILFKLGENESFATFRFRRRARYPDEERVGRGFKFIYSILCGDDTCPESTPEQSTLTYTLPVTDPTSTTTTQSLTVADTTTQTLPETAPTSTQTFPVTDPTTAKTVPATGLATTQTLPVTDHIANETLSKNMLNHTTAHTSVSHSSASQLSSSKKNTTIIVTVGAGISVTAVTFIIAAACYKIRSRRKHYVQQDDELVEMEHDWYRSLEPATAMKLKEILIKPDRLCFNYGNALGEGYFGNIYHGELQTEETEDNQMICISQVAVKVLKDVRDIERDNLANKLVKEALLLSGFSHENVLNTLGICIPQRGQLCVVLPYMAHGDLRRFVKNKDTKLSVGDLMSLAQHVAKGMEYLSSNLFIHRDLAARNCLVGIDYIVKIADFGLSRDIYKKGYYTQLNLTSVPLPVKWTALEGLKSGTFTSFSDVWSFGVLVWELFSRGGEPYADVNIWEMKSYLEQGRRLEAPQGTPPDIYKLMTTCWEVQPDRRPTFKEIVEYLDKSLGSRE